MWQVCVFIYFTGNFLSRLSGNDDFLLTTDRFHLILVVFYFPDLVYCNRRAPVSVTSFNLASNVKSLEQDLTLPTRHVKRNARILLKSKTNWKV